MKLTKEDLDKFVVEMEQNDLAGLSFHKGTVFELLRLARLGMWAEEHKDVIEALLDREAMHGSNLWAPEANAAYNLRPKR